MQVKIFTSGKVTLQFYHAIARWQKDLDDSYFFYYIRANSLDNKWWQWWLRKSRTNTKHHTISAWFMLTLWILIKIYLDLRLDSRFYSCRVSVVNLETTIISEAKFISVDRLLKRSFFSKIILCQMNWERSFHQGLVSQDFSIRTKNHRSNVNNKMAKGDLIELPNLNCL